MTTGKRYLAAGDDKGRVRIWDLKERKAFKTFPSHSDSVLAICVFGAAGTASNLVASGDARGVVALHDLTRMSAERLHAFQDGQPIRRLCSLSNGERLAVAGDSGVVSVIALSSRQTVWSSRAHTCPCTGVAEFGKSVITCGLDKRIVISGSGKDSEAAITVGVPLTSLTVSREASAPLAVAGCIDGTLFVYDLRKYDSPLHELRCGTPANRFTAAVHTVEFTPRTIRLGEVVRRKTLVMSARKKNAAARTRTLPDAVAMTPSTAKHRGAVDHLSFLAESTGTVVRNSAGADSITAKVSEERDDIVKRLAQTIGPSSLLSPNRTLSDESLASKGKGSLRIDPEAVKESARLLLEGGKTPATLHHASPKLSQANQEAAFSDEPPAANEKEEQANGNASSAESQAAQTLPQTSAALLASDRALSPSALLEKAIQSVLPALEEDPNFVLKTPHASKAKSLFASLPGTVDGNAAGLASTAITPTGYEGGGTLSYSQLALDTETASKGSLSDLSRLSALQPEATPRRQPPSIDPRSLLPTTIKKPRLDVNASGAHDTGVAEKHLSRLDAAFDSVTPEKAGSGKISGRAEIFRGSTALLETPSRPALRWAAKQSYGKASNGDATTGTGLVATDVEMEGRLQGKPPTSEEKLVSLTQRSQENGIFVANEQLELLFQEMKEMRRQQQELISVVTELSRRQTSRDDMEEVKKLIGESRSSSQTLAEFAAVQTSAFTSKVEELQQEQMEQTSELIENLHVDFIKQTEALRQQLAATRADMNELREENAYLKEQLSLFRQSVF